MSDKELKNMLFAIVTLTPFITFAVIEFAPWWVSTPFTIISVIWWLGAFFLMGVKKKGDTK